VLPTSGSSAPPTSGRWPGPPTRASRGSRATCSGAWTTGSPTWATGASRASGTGACPALLPMRVRGASPWSARAGSSGAGHGSDGGGRSAGAAPPVARRHPHPLPRLRAARAAHPRGRDCWLTPASYRSRRWAISRIAGSGSAGSRRLHRRGRGAAPRMVLRDALHGPRHWKARAPIGPCWRMSGSWPPTGGRCTRVGATPSGSTMRSRKWPRRDPPHVRLPAITEPIRFSFEAARDVKRRFLTFWNVYSLFVTYANLDRPPLQGPDSVPLHVAQLEQWLLTGCRPRSPRSGWPSTRIRSAGPSRG